MASSFHFRGTGLEDTTASYSFRNKSRAEETIERGIQERQRVEELPPGFQQKFRIIDGREYPCHPEHSDKVSRFPVGFRGCFNCGRSQKCLNRECFTGQKPPPSFHFEMNCHFPKTWFRYRSNLPTDTPNKRVSFNSDEGNRRGSGRGRSTTLPSWLDNNKHGSISHPQSSSSRRTDDSYDRVEFHTANQFVQIVIGYVHRDSSRRRMPISTDNDLPHVPFPIGKHRNVASIMALYDTGGALNSGNLSYHRDVIMKKIPETIASFEEFNGSNPFEPIKLLAAITEPSAYDASKHGILSAVVRYHTPFKLPNGSPFILSFALGEDMSVDSILGIPLIKELQMDTSFRTKEIISHSLKTPFPCLFRETKLTPSDTHTPGNDSNNAPTSNSANMTVPSLLVQASSSLQSALVALSENDST